MRILMTVGEVTIEGAFDATPTAVAVYNALPIDARANTWGKEIYFTVPVEADLEPSAKTVLRAGDIAYWPTGKALCLFFGPTPLSKGFDPVAAGPVNVIGSLKGDFEGLEKVKSGDIVHLQKIESA